NAVDGAIAAAAMMTIVEPCSNGLGSDAFCIVWDGERLHGLNASGPAPAAWSREYFRRRLGGAVRALRQAAVRRPARAGDRRRRARLRGADRRPAEVGGGGAAARVAARLGRRVPAARPCARGRRAL